MGEIADGVNALISLGRGDVAGATLSAASMLPIVGDAIGKGGKIARAAIKHGDEVLEAGTKLLRQSNTKADILAQNRIRGRAYEQQEFAKFSQQNTHSVEQITVTTYTGTRTRIDAMGIDLNGDIVMREFKSSASAPLTRNQRKAFQEIKENGGVVMGKGKDIFTGGYRIPAGTEVVVIKPQ